MDKSTESQIKLLLQQKDNLELYSTLNEMAEDMYNAEGVNVAKGEWQRKYVAMRLQ